MSQIRVIRELENMPQSYIDPTRAYDPHALPDLEVFQLTAIEAAEMEDDLIDVKPGTCIVIPAGVRHRAVGRMKVLIFVLPKFDPADEWFD